MITEMREVNPTDRPRSISPFLNGGWAKFGILCLIVAATAIVAPAQDEQPSADSVKFSTLLNFDVTNGEAPAGPPSQGLDGNLYAVAFAGGTNGSGTVFKITPGGTLTTLYNFCSQTNCADGGSPAGALVLGSEGTLYGITQSGGTTGNGTAFKTTPGGTLTTLYNWCSQLNNADGCFGLETFGATLIQATDGNFYGANNAGCPAACTGTVFKLSPNGTLTTLYTFCLQSGCLDGAYPSSLVQGIDGNFYGITNSGGAYGYGTVFKITPSGTLTTLYSFCSQGGLGVCTDGALPFGPLVEAPDGSFYGSTTYGGANVNSASCMAEFGYCGTIFKTTPSGTLTTVYNFCSQTSCTDGANPEFGLILATDGNFYGSTVAGGTTSCTTLGTPGCGTLYKLTPAGALTTLHGFIFSDGVEPTGLAQATNGTFYGTTWGGGPTNSGCFFYSSCGTVFALSVGLGPFIETLPTSGKVGTPVKILGSNLTGATAVSFNGTVATFKVISPTLISATVPAGATTGFVTVTVNGKTLKSNVKFQVRP